MTTKERLTVFKAVKQADHLRKQQTSDWILDTNFEEEKAPPISTCSVLSVRQD